MDIKVKSTSPPILKIRSTGLTERYASREDSSINYEVIRLVLHGFATSAISHHTGLTCAQVQNRVRMYKLQGVRSMFRMGQTAASRSVMKMAMRVSPQKKLEEKDLYQAVRDGILEAYKKEKVLS
jgi:hypothetical protein